MLRDEARLRSLAVLVKDHRWQPRMLGSEEKRKRKTLSCHDVSKVINTACLQRKAEAAVVKKKEMQNQESCNKQLNDILYRTMTSQ